jgi:hypothetical protein
MSRWLSGVLVAIVALPQGMTQAMPESTPSLLDEAGRVARELAAQQGLAYTAFGDALQRFGDSRLGWTELLKVAGDIYLKEAARSFGSMARANITVYTWLLSLAGAKSLRAEAGSTPETPPSARQSQRGRR